MSNITTQTIRVDLSTDKVLPTAFTHQNDTARTLEFSMYNNGVPYDMTGNTVKFAYKSPIVDGQYYVIAGSGMASGTVSGNKVTVTLPSAYTAISGVGMLTMIITPSSGTVRPVNIRLVVQKSADGADEIAGASDFVPVLEEYMTENMETYISAWLDDHPEATTTVQDHSLTLEKLMVGALGFVTPQMYGAMGDDITDDTEAFKNAMENTNVFIPSGTYLITDTIPVKSNVILGDNSKIDFLSSSWKKQVFLYGSDDSIYVKGIHLDCHDMAAMGHYVDKNENADTLSNICFDSCSVKNTQNLLTAVTSGGIVIDRVNENSVVKNCIVKTVKRNTSNPGVIASVGIHVGEITGTCSIENNLIDGVYYASDSKYDADGIHAYTNLNTVIDGISINIQNNDIRNCQGRFIKGQAENTNVIGNTCSNDNLEMMDTFTSFDFQTGKGNLISNTVNITDCTGGASAIHVKVSGHTSTREMVYGFIDGNKFISNIKFGYVFQLYGLATYRNSFHVINNFIVNFVNAILIAGNAPFTNAYDLIYENNSFYDYTRAVFIQSAVSTSTKINISANSNTGENEKPLKIAIVTVPNTVTGYQDVMKYVGDQITSTGVVVVQIVWTGHESSQAFYSYYSTVSYQLVWWRNDRMYVQVYTGGTYYTYEFDSVATLPAPTI